MKVISSGLLAHLQQDTTTLATCVKLTRRDGLVLGYTTHDRPLTFDCDGLGAVTYEPQGGYKRSAIASQLGLSADNVELEGLITDEAITDEDLLKGVYDNAELKFMLVNWSDLTHGVLKLRRGYVGTITVHRDTYIAEIRGLMDAYSTVIGELYTPDCTVYELGDERCKVDLDTPEFTVSCTVSAVTAPQPGESGTYQFQVTPDLSHLQPEPGGLPWFAMGKATWMTGANVGAVGHELKAWDSATNTATLFLSTTYPIAVGDSLILTVGCDKRKQTCIERFHNIVNFRGFPFLPGLDAALQYPSPHTV